MEFELQPEAWEVAQALLSESHGNNYRFYGANIFYNKIRRDFHQLRDRYGSPPLLILLLLLDPSLLLMALGSV